MHRSAARAAPPGVVLLIIALGSHGAAADPGSLDGAAVFTKACASCHATGKPNNPAPQLTDKDDWAERIRGGRAGLYQNAINGYQGYYAMPARGGDAGLSDNDVKAAVDYMVSKITAP